MTRGSTTGLGVAVVVLLCASAAQAQEGTDAESVLEAQEDVERARFLFGEGVACIENEDWACAERTFREVMELRDAPTVRYNLALALFELGRYPEASRLIASVTSDPETDPEVAEQANALNTRLQEGSATLTVMLSPALIGATVQVDGEAIPPEQATVRVAAGERVVSAHRGEEEVARQTVEAVAGESHTVELEAPLPPEPEEPEEAPVPQPEPPPESMPEWVLWASIGAAAALVVVVTTIVIVAVTNGAEGPIEGNYQPGVLRWD